MTGVIFGISGSIAAYKAIEVIRMLLADGIEVWPVLSHGGAKFVTRTTVEAITGKQAVTEIFPEPSRQEIEHIALARKADLLVTCPASADIIAKYAMGISDDPLALAALAFGTPHLIVPAMNHRMWEHPATKQNVQILKERGCVFVGPGHGMMACGEEGWGRLASLDEIYGNIRMELGKNGPLNGRKILVSAGGTKEFIDDVRFLSNLSSGKMGHALAAEARNLGATVVLVTASDLTPPAGMRVEHVVSADEMANVILRQAETSDVVLMAAAVSDFTPVEKTAGKMKKSDKPESIDLKLARTVDILAELGIRKTKGQVLVGFAAEYGPDGLDEAKRKCMEKGCTAFCLNDISRDDIGFAADQNEVTIVCKEGEILAVPKGPKAEVARAIIGRVRELLEESVKDIIEK